MTDARPNPEQEPTVGRSTAASQQPDPLADLRQDDDDQPDTPPVQENKQDGEGEDGPLVEVRAMVTQETWDEMVAEVVAAWHHDPTSLGFLHGGGSVCGCAYIARHALRACVPVMTEEDLEEKELEPSE